MLNNQLKKSTSLINNIHLLVNYKGLKKSGLYFYILNVYTLDTIYIACVYLYMCVGVGVGAYIYVFVCI